MSKTIIISEKQVEQFKKVRQGIIAYENTQPDYEIGFEKPTDMSAYAHVTPAAKAITEDEGGYTPLFIGFSDYELINVLSKKIIKPERTNFEGKKEVWLTIKPYGHPCVLEILIPNKEIGDGKSFTTTNDKDFFTDKPINLKVYEYNIKRCSGIDITEENLAKWRKWYSSNDKKHFQLIETLMERFGDLWDFAVLPLIESCGVINERIYRQLLNEENRTQKKKCVENITNFISPMARPHLDTPLTELPYIFKNMCEQAQGLYQAVSTNQNGCNRFIDFLRLNLYSQFAIGRDGALVQFIPGISRIACDDLRYYAMDTSIRGGEMLLFAKVLKLIKYKTDFMLNDVQLDPDFNGMSYEQFMELFYEKSQIHLKEMNDLLDDGEKELTSEEYYDIIPIDDRINSYYGAGGTLVPTPESMRLLRHLGNYCDWCVSGPQGEFEYAQYLSNGGKMYVCIKRGFEDIPREQGENCPLDEYGLSLINVIVGDDGMPDNITTRWNHDFGGENHEGLWYASQLQKILNVNYRQVFKPRPREELRRLGILRENKNNENFIEETVEPKDVDLSSFDLKKTLNPKFWKNEKLDSRIRLKLLDLADDFVDSFKVENLEVDDIIMTGSLAGYTWNDKFSDIDIHILLDFKRFDKDTDFLTDYFKLKKDEWNEKHKDLKIFGFPVEVYVQDVNEHHVSNSVYSLEENEWVTKPNRSKLSKEKFDDDTVQEQVAEYMNKIDELEEKFNSAEIETDLEDIYNEACELFDDIKKTRSDRMKRKDANELSDGNIIFKSLRRSEYIEKLIDIRDSSYNKCNSLS